MPLIHRVCGLVPTGALRGVAWQCAQSRVSGRSAPWVGVLGCLSENRARTPPGGKEPPVSTHGAQALSRGQLSTRTASLTPESSAQHRLEHKHRSCPHVPRSPPQRRPDPLIRRFTGSLLPGARPGFANASSTEWWDDLQGKEKQYLKRGHDSTAECKGDSHPPRLLTLVLARNAMVREERSRDTCWKPKN